MHDNRAALLETAQPLAGGSAAVHYGSFSQVNQVLDAVQRLDDDGLAGLVRFLNRAFERDSAGHAVNGRRLLARDAGGPNQQQSGGYYGSR
jgi:hypothetical protein